MDNENTLKQLHFLLDNNMEVNIYNEAYQVKNDRGDLIVVCKYNQSTIGLPHEDIKKCFTNKWNVRENKELQGFNIIAS
tara:strand:- start:288 stop:524 length:237 start_codon:yes stop_codon:yes gene_type:complete